MPGVLTFKDERDAGDAVDLLNTQLPGADAKLDPNDAKSVKYKGQQPEVERILKEKYELVAGEWQPKPQTSNPRGTAV